MTTDWFRNTTWNESIERAFNDKISRARKRNKEQYLRIQAYTLANSHPEIALKLLDRCFELPDDIDHAQAYVDRATAYLALSRVEDAISSYEAAINREIVFPNVQTGASLDLPYLVATRSLREYYQRAIELLVTHKGPFWFPFQHFRWHTAIALIASDNQEHETARLHAGQALEWAARDNSGFRYHPSIGLVTKQYDEIVKKLKTLRQHNNRFNITGLQESTNMKG